MGEVTINYTNLNMAGQFAGKARAGLEEYGSDLNTRILTGLESLPGGDSAGYISTAVSLASEKCCNISKARDYFEELKPRIDKLSVHAREADERVKKKIDSIAEYNLGRVGFLTAIGNKLYDIFCIDMPDALAVSPLLDAFIDSTRRFYNWVEDGREIICDWFRYGDGQYIKNIILSVGKVLATAAAIAGFALIAAPFTLICAAGLIAGGIVLVCKFCDMTKVVESNMKALVLCNTSYYDDNGKDTGVKKKGYAHYYGGISGVSDYYEKYDTGSAEDNLNAEIASIIFDGVRDGSEMVFNTLNFIASMSSTAAVYDLDGESIIGYDFSPEHMLEATRENVQEMFQNPKELDDVKKTKITVKFFEKIVGKDSDTIYEFNKNPEISKWYDAGKAHYNSFPLSFISELGVNEYLDPLFDLWEICDQIYDFKTV